MARMKIAVASGKGGVGKSMVSSCLSLLFKKNSRVVAVDADVDAPNLHLWLGKGEVWDQVEKISTNQLAVVDDQKCLRCGECVNQCVFGALTLEKEGIVVNPYFCEGCGACEVVCPHGAISLQPVVNAEIKFMNDVHGIPLVSAQLYPGNTGSGKIVDEILERAQQQDYEIMTIDCPAGTGCPVVAALKQADYVVLVTEPTPAGFADLERVKMVIDDFNLNYGVVVNKWDVNPSLYQEIAARYSDRFLGRISYNKKVFELISQLRPLVGSGISQAKEIESVLMRLRDILKL